MTYYDALTYLPKIQSKISKAYQRKNMTGEYLDLLHSSNYEILVIFDISLLTAVFCWNFKNVEDKSLQWKSS